MNDGQVGVAIERLRAELGSLEGVPVLVLGLTYREGVKELAYSRALALIEASLRRARACRPGIRSCRPSEIRALRRPAWTWGAASDARAIVVQTADPAFRALDPAWFPRLEVVLDGRNALDGVRLGGGVRILGVGRPARGEWAERAGVG